jgi:murein DD-endopeptidase MepM/ murein hydrolase activator NlpD
MLVQILNKKSIYTPIDLSIHNKDIQELQTANDYEKYIASYLQEKQATIAYGGYVENRNLYKRSAIFNVNKNEVRNIHIGIDFWCGANATIVAPCKGIVHSYQNNIGFGNYGPTIILQHTNASGKTYYSLYGHLSIQSIATIQIGQTIAKGETIGTLGDATVNGDYAPHVHLQIIYDMQGMQGDYPGVCSQQQLEFYKSNCPDPLLIVENLLG